MRNQVKLPQTIGLNAIDRAFIIPETEESDSAHFPMSVAATLRFKQPLAATKLITAVQKVEQKFPQLRLGYSLDVEHYRWRRVPDDQLESHLASLVKVDQSNCELQQLLSKMITVNNTPLTNPIMFVLHDRDLIVK